MNQALFNKVDGERPLYDQVYQTLLQQIGNGTYPVQQKLPSEKELSELFNVSRITIRQALNQLQLEHLVYRFRAKALLLAHRKHSRTFLSYRALPKPCAIWDMKCLTW